MDEHASSRSRKRPIRKLHSWEVGNSRYSKRPPGTEVTRQTKNRSHTVNWESSNQHSHLRIFNIPKAWTIPTLCPTGTTSSWESKRHVWRRHQNTNGCLYTSFFRKKVQACMQLLRVEDDRTRWWSSCSTVRAVIWRHTSRTRWTCMMNDSHPQWGYQYLSLEAQMNTAVPRSPESSQAY